MQNDKKSKKNRIKKLRKILDNGSNKDLPPEDEKYLKALSKRLGESSRQDMIYRNLVSKEKGEKVTDSMKPKVTIYPREEKKVVDFKEVEEEKPELEIEKPSEISPLPVKELKYEDEDVFEVEKVEVTGPEFIEVKPKEIEKEEIEEAFEEKKALADEELPEWKPLEPELEKAEEKKEETLVEKKVLSDEELTEWEPVDVEIEKVEKERIEEKEKPKVTNKFCGQCGAILEEMGNFCPECGYKINADYEEPKEEKPEPIEKEEQLPVFIPVKEVEEKEEIAVEELEIKKREKAEELDEDKKSKIEVFKDIESIDDKTALQLYDNGFTTIDSIAIASIKDLIKIKGVKRKTAKKIKTEIEQKSEWEPVDVEEFDIGEKEDESLEIEPIPIGETAEGEVTEEQIEVEEEITAIEEKIGFFKDMESIDDKTALLLYDNGYTTIDYLRRATLKDLTKIKGIKRKVVKNIKKEIDKKIEESVEVKPIDMGETPEGEVTEEQIQDEDEVVEKEEELSSPVELSAESAEWGPVTEEELEKKEVPEEPSIERELKIEVFKDIESIDDKTALLLYDNGFTTIDSIAIASIKELTKIKGIKRKTAKKIKTEIEQKYEWVSEDVKDDKIVESKEENLGEPFVEEEEYKVEEATEIDKKILEYEHVEDEEVEEVEDEWESFDEHRISESKMKEIKGFRYGDYTLYEKELDTKSGKKRIVRFFSKAEPEEGNPIELPKGFEVKENKKTGLPYLKKKK